MLETDPAASALPAPRPSPDAESYDRRGIIAALALLSLTFVLASVDTAIGHWLAQIALQGTLFVAAWALVSNAPSAMARRRRLGLAESRLPLRTRFIVMLMSLCVVAAMSMLFGGLSSMPLERPFASAMLGPPAIFLSLVVLPSVCEELFFRGALQSWLTRRIGAAQAILLGALLFASLHVSAGPRAVAFSWILGLCLGALAHRSGSIREAISIHALINGAYFASQFG